MLLSEREIHDVLQIAASFHARSVKVMRWTVTLAAALGALALLCAGAFAQEQGADRQDLVDDFVRW